MNHRITPLIAVFLLHICEGIACQELKISEQIVMFWNVENLFDPFCEDGLQGYEFTPSGDKRWTWSRFLKKRDNIAKTILSVRDYYGEYPFIVGFAEVENRFVLNNMIYQTALSQVGYRVVHRESPDIRGIDVALIYRPDIFKVSNVRTIDQKDSTFITRSVLYVKGVLSAIDTLHLFVNHWPSKLGGVKASDKRRMSVAKAIKKELDSLIDVGEKNIIVMGDFNDGINSPALNYLEEEIEGGEERLVNLSRMVDKKSKGTIKYRGRWEKIDHFFVPEAMINIRNRLQFIYVEEKDVYIYAPDFLLEKDNTFLGLKPFRTYIGPRYNGGVSDHLPIVLKLKQIL